MKIVHVSVTVTLVGRLFGVAKALMCTPEVCQRCCAPVATGCAPAFQQTEQGFLVSDYTFCQECDCNDPGNGCGWLAYGTGRMQCSSCDFLRPVAQRLPGAEISGCGTVALNGQIVYNDMPDTTQARLGFTV
ncbi:UNVERIFIED_CONTAM: hypothetical protein HHA_290250 [Hammondia hammondi]|eukprot:XP_008889183.1 hypothetical protein HHA_290250 [Hammondia hammondi]